MKPPAKLPELGLEPERGGLFGERAATLENPEGWELAEAGTPWGMTSGEKLRGKDEGALLRRIVEWPC